MLGTLRVLGVFLCTKYTVGIPTKEPANQHVEFPSRLKGRVDLVPTRRLPFKPIVWQIVRSSEPKTSAMPTAMDRHPFCNHGRRCSVQQAPQQSLHRQNQGEVRVPHLQVSRCSCLFPRQEKVEAHLAGRIRKVKCDEGRPACHRCVSTGRICDGYGIWGGGGNFYGHRQRCTGSKVSSIAPWPPACLSIFAVGTEEKQYYEWFRCRTAKKIPGLFVLTFWDTLILQASLSEPAVLHAVLTLSSFHRKEILHGNRQSRNEDPPDQQEQFMLQHYIKAIIHLQPHFSTKNSESVRVALITCVVFISLELLRGHFKTAQTYLQNGLKVLRKMQSPFNVDNDGILLLKPTHNSIDDWIFEALSRLHVQVELFKQTYQHPCLALQASEPEPPIPLFHSFNEAWQQMERLLNKVFHLTELGRQQRVSECQFFGNPSPLLGHQQHIQAELAQWLDAYEASRKYLQGRHGQDTEGFACQLLCAYHTMANIMADTCLWPDDELMFDSYTNEFVSLITQLANMWKIRSSNSQVQALPGRLMDMSRSVVDIGWIPPLYYVALKCRVHRVRLQAIRLLESTSHREGIWDSNIAACVTRKVMEIEERDFYKDFDTADHFPLSSYPGSGDLSLPNLPDFHRLHEVEVALSDDPQGNILLFCRQYQRGGDSNFPVREYHVLLQPWTDGADDKLACKLAS